MQHSTLQALLPHLDITQGTKRSSSGMSRVGFAHTRADDRKVSESELMVFRSALSALGKHHSEHKHHLEAFRQISRCSLPDTQSVT